MFRFPKFKFNYALSGEAVVVFTKDIKEGKLCFANRSYKATMVLCGSILELALLDRLSIDSNLARTTYSTIFNRRARRLERWSLSEMLQVARQLNFLSLEAFQLCDLLRNYRNLIHPAVSRRLLIDPNQTRALRSLEATRQTLSELETNFANVWQNVYIINIRNIFASFIGNKKIVETAITNFAQQRNFTVYRITTYSALRNLLRNPPRNAIIANTHGEIMPVPRGRNWRNFYRDLGKAVRDFGWILINVGGYPFFYQRPGRVVGQDGLNTFLSVINSSADCGNIANATFTREGTNVTHRGNMRGLSQSLLVERCARWRGISQKIVFMRSNLLCGASAVRVGRGWFIQFGLSSGLGRQNPPQAQLDFFDRIQGNLGIAFALFVADRL